MSTALGCYRQHMHSHILRKVMIAMLTLLFGASSMIFSTKQSYADVKIERDAPFRGIFIYNTISKTDANYIAQRETDFESGGTAYRALQCIGPAPCQGA
jgi:hypothetical protein